MGIASKAVGNAEEPIGDGQSHKRRKEGGGIWILFSHRRDGPEERWRGWAMPLDVEEMTETRP